MVNDESDREEIDGLIRNLTTAKPAAGASNRRPPMTAPLVPLPVAPRRAERQSGRRWTDFRELMASMPDVPAGLERAAAIGSAIRLPALPGVRHFLRLPGPVATARLWVGLGLVFGVAMAFWPYSKTYPWGLALYLLTLGLMEVAGLWGARLSWDARLGSAHTVAVMTAFWGIVLATAETLPLV